jgi:hypothetical protein
LWLNIRYQILDIETHHAQNPKPKKLKKKSADLVFVSEVMKKRKVLLSNELTQI